MTIDELIERSHAMAVERSVVYQVNNFHAEISEAWEEYRAGRIATWYRSVKTGRRFAIYDPESIRLEVGSGMAKPEGFWIEIADLLIRIAATMGAHGWQAKSLELEPPQSLPMLIHRLHTFVCDLTDANVPDWHMGADIQANVIISVCLAAAERNGIDLLSLCELKMAYNATRPIRHGGKRA